MSEPWKKLLVISALLTVGVVSIAGYQVYSFSSAIPSLFRRNAELKADGYYMAEFEFKMLGILKQLSDGDYLTAFFTFRQLQQEMETGEGLKRMPANASPRERMDFLLSRQAAATGAFMDPAYPYFTYIAPTLNVVEALESLSKQTGQPLRLKYPLVFLDRIAKPEALRAYLDSLLYMGRFWAENFPGPGDYGPGVSELAYFDVLERTDTYHFSAAWKNEFRQWLDETQDPETGLWGTRIGSSGAWKQKFDPNSTYHILHFVLNKDGSNRNDAYPLRHANALAATLVKAVAAPIPTGEDEQHTWSLDQAQATQMLTRLLWEHLDEAARGRVKDALSVALEQRYRLFRREDGGFSIYLSTTAADIDGTSTALGLIAATGSFPGTAERNKLWGDSTVVSPTPVVISSLTDIRVPQSPAINSLRLYAAAGLPNDSLDDEALVAILYPVDKGHILDIMDLRQNLKRFIESNSASIGNWASVDSVNDGTLRLSSPMRSVPVTAVDRADWRAIEEAAGTSPFFTLVGFDIFQRPVSVQTYKRL